MAGCDYYSCDICGGKTFYDAEVQPAWERGADKSVDAGWVVYAGCGAIKALCPKCAKTHEIKIVKKEDSHA